MVVHENHRGGLMLEGVGDLTAEGRIVGMLRAVEQTVRIRLLRLLGASTSTTLPLTSIPA